MLGSVVDDDFVTYSKLQSPGKVVLPHSIKMHLFNVVLVTGTGVYGKNRLLALLVDFGRNASTASKMNMRILLSLAAGASSSSTLSP
jgi:hypothetical protein